MAVKTKKKTKIKFVCDDCGHINKPTNESTKQWNVFNPECDKCGGVLEPEIE
ncbi:hypothetical protein LCGC14_1354330 [marine sediment metagenome]|uniref:Uncharacterized protein n=1 Tax=marine sediment metagenome TaxID=412755 RepID=A0A0F9K9X0_9ZZZZ